MVGALIATAVVLIIVVGGVAYALRPDDKPPQPSKPTPVAAACGYKIAYLGLLSGDDKAFGEAYRNAARLAVDKYNSNHAGCTADLIEYDTRDSSDEAARQADQLVKDDKIVGVVGPVGVSEAKKAMPILDAAGVTAITPVLSVSELSQSGWKTFHRTVGTDREQAASGARYLTTVLRAQRVFVVADTDDYAAGVASEVRLRLNTAFAGRADITGEEADFSGVVTQITNAPADAVYFAGFSAAGGTFVKQLRTARPDIKIVTWDRLLTNAFLDKAGKAAAEGVVMTCACIPNDEAKNNFASDYKSRFGDSLPLSLPETFDAATVLLSALGAGKATRADVLKYVHNYDGEGITRRIKFAANGDLASGGPTVWAFHVRDGDIAKDRLIANA